tara:strand:+ start:8741 stop:9385 length:645 start_codon:yes stop_codon:yes gene_type:complete
MRPVQWGELRKVKPFSNIFGYDRGQSINRYYIENFLNHHKSSITGHVLEFGDNRYTTKYGQEKILKSDVIHPTNENKEATIISDIVQSDNIMDNSFDCIICIQTLQFIFDFDQAIENLYRILKPNGVLLCSMSGISQISRYDMERWGEYWRFTDASTKRIFEKYFNNECIITTYGNVLVATAYLQGLSSHELTADELDYNDPDYQAFITVRAVK